MKNLIICILISIILLSCSSEQTIIINSDESANIQFNVTNKKSLIETFLNWNSLSNKVTDSIININEVKKGLEKNDSISKVEITEYESNKFSGSFFVSNIEDIFSDPTIIIPNNVKLFSLKTVNNVKTFKIELSLNNYKYLKNFLPILKEESIDMLGPDANLETSKSEYLDMISFSLGENGPNDLLNSYINLKINVEGNIINIINGKKLDNNTVLFKIPLLDVILLKEKLLFSFSYK